MPPSSRQVLVDLQMRPWFLECWRFPFAGSGANHPTSQRARARARLKDAAKRHRRGFAAGGANDPRNQMTETQEGFIKVPKDIIDLTTDKSSDAMVRARSDTEINQQRMNELIKRASAAAPPAVAVYITKAAPAIKATWYFLVNFVGPFYLQVWQLCVYAYETLPIELIEALIGLSMCFCGGAYCASIAAVEAFRMTGWDTTRRALRDVYTDAKPIIAAWKADDKKDDDKDGVPDVHQLVPAELLKRKVQVTAVAVKDPDKLLAACGGLYTSWLAVQGTLRLQFAKTITLGVSIATELDKPIARVAVPILVGVMPPQYHHWIPALLRTASKMVAVAIAWQLQVTSLVSSTPPPPPTHHHTPTPPTLPPAPIYCTHACAGGHLGGAVVGARRLPRRAQAARVRRQARPPPVQGVRPVRRALRLHARPLRLLHAVAVGLRAPVPAQPRDAAVHPHRVVRALGDHGLVESTRVRLLRLLVHQTKPSRASHKSPRGSRAWCSPLSVLCAVGMMPGA